MRDGESIMAQSGIYDEFAEALTMRFKELKVGRGIDKGVFIGPLTHDRAIGKAMAHINGESKCSLSCIFLICYRCKEVWRTNHSRRCSFGRD